MCQKCVEAGEMTQEEANAQNEMFQEMGGEGILGALLGGLLGNNGPQFGGDATPSMLMMAQIANEYPELNLETNQDFIGYIKSARDNVNGDPIMDVIVDFVERGIGAVFGMDESIANITENQPEGFPEELADMLKEKASAKAKDAVTVTINLFHVLKLAVDVKNGVVPAGETTH